ncbi:MAG: tetratricopeptide repeat protein [Bacteroidales bacterium]|nr:tetratricopeptide repeat protein [Bacteroidales bacterium]MCF8386931.1 tetratricopeptide repeat protein [Bacteroidales bacterium]MCF8399358.1 tetratricopeptide repeat protein [Bacteroidales bacterium]
MAKAKSAKKKRKPDFLTASGTTKQYRVFAFIIVLLCIGLYFNTYFNYFSLDDYFVTENNEQTSQGFSAIPEIFTTVYGSNQEDQYGYRPLVRVSFTIDYELWNGNPAYSHMFNLLLYIINILILFSLLRRLLRNYNVFFPFIIVLIYLAHPVFTEVVASLKNRDILLSTLFGLLSTMQFIKWIDRDKVKYLLFGILLYIFAILSKETAFAFAFLFPLILYFFTDISKKRIWYFIGSVFVLTLVFVLGPRLFLEDIGRNYRFYENPLVEENIFTRFTTGMYVLLLYLKKLIFPYPLLYYYGYDVIPVKGLLDGWVLLSILIHGALFVYAVYHFKRKSLSSFVILFYLINMGMISNIVSPVPGIMAERFLFLPGIAFAIMIGYIVFRIFGYDPKKAFVKKGNAVNVLLLTLVILIPYSVYTHNRNKNWRTKYTLYSHDIKHLENSVKAHDLLATELVDQLMSIFNNPDPGKIPPPVKSQRRPIETALRHYKRIIEIYPKHHNAWNNIGTIQYKIKKKPELAIPYYKKTIKLKPDFPNPYVNLAEIYAEQGKTDTAISLYSKVFTLDSSNMSPLSRIANIHARSGEIEKAKQVNRKIMELDPGSYLPYLNLGYYATREGDSAQARQYFEGAIEKGFEGNVYDIMAQIYKSMGDNVKAYEYDRMAREYDRNRKQK